MLSAVWKLQYSRISYQEIDRLSTGVGNLVCSIVAGINRLQFTHNKLPTWAGSMDQVCTVACPPASYFSLLQKMMNPRFSAQGLVTQSQSSSLITILSPKEVTVVSKKKKLREEKNIISRYIRQGWRQLCQKLCKNGVKIEMNTTCSKGNCLKGNTLPPHQPDGQKLCKVL